MGWAPHFQGTKPLNYGGSNGQENGLSSGSWEYIRDDIGIQVYNEYMYPALKPEIYKCLHWTIWSSRSQGLWIVFCKIRQVRNSILGLGV